MKILLCISLFLTFAVFLSSPALAQRQSDKIQANKIEPLPTETLAIKRTSSEKTICKKETLPTAYKIVGETTKVTCAEGAWVIRRRGEIVFRNDPLPVRPSPVQRREETDDEVAAKPVRRNATAPSVQPSSNDAPSRAEIETAVRRATVILGMGMQDVSRAWGTSHTNDSLVEDGLRINIWEYRRGQVYFRDGVVYRVILLKDRSRR